MADDAKDDAQRWHGWVPGHELIPHLGADGYHIEHLAVFDGSRPLGRAVYKRGGAVLEEREAMELLVGPKYVWHVRLEPRDGAAGDILGFREALAMPRR